MRWEHNPCRLPHGPSRSLQSRPSPDLSGCFQGCPTSELSFNRCHPGNCQSLSFANASVSTFWHRDPSTVQMTWHECAQFVLSEDGEAGGIEERMRTEQYIQYTILVQCCPSLATQATMYLHGAASQEPLLFKPSHTKLEWSTT
jgi:hypothetical protein